MSPRRTVVLPLLAVAAALGFAAAFFRLWRFVIDDAFISLRYARNLALGHGLVYNAGERVEGYTNFLWTLFLALPHLLRVDPIAAGKIANLILALATAWIVYRLGRETIVVPPPAVKVAASGGKAGARRAPGSRAPAARGEPATGAAGGAHAAPGADDAAQLAALAAFLFLAMPAVVLSAAEGMETMLFTFLLALGALWFFTEREPRSFPRSALALAALALTRPDGAVYGPFF